MSHDAQLHTCIHPGCTRWALYNDAACPVHAGLVSEPPESPRYGGTVGGQGSGRGAAQSLRDGGTVGGHPVVWAPGGHLAWPASAMPLDPPPLPSAAQQLSLLIAHRDSLDRYIRLSLGYRSRPLADELDYLRALSRLATDLAAALSRPSDVAGMDEIDRFLDEVAREARESPCWQTDDPYAIAVGATQRSAP